MKKHSPASSGLAAQHILEDLGFIPTVAECLSELHLRPWMVGGRQLLTTAHSLLSLSLTLEPRVDPDD